MADAPGDGLLVGVNLLWCLPGGVGGSEEYLARQLTGLRRAAPEVRLRLAVLPGYPAAHPQLAAGEDEGIDVVVAPLDARRRGRRVVAESTWLPRRMHGISVLHHGGGTVPARSPRPIVVTIHDLQFLRHPAYVAPLKLRYLSVAVPHAVRRAAVVAVVAVVVIPVVATSVAAAVVAVIAIVIAADVAAARDRGRGRATRIAVVVVVIVAAR